MCSNVKGLFKRILPFFATFAVGLFIASFFVSVSGPRFEGFRGRGWQRHKMFERIQTENEQLKNENLRLRNELENRHINMGEFYDGLPRRVGPEVPVEAPLPPPPPRIRR